eukprot:3432314-Lingulodinium_polyedra.AAC.1
MASEKSTKLRPCVLCEAIFTHFKLMEFYREEHAYEKRERDDDIRYWRICVKCETTIRVSEFAKWTDEQKKEDPRYAEEWK